MVVDEFVVQRSTCVVAESVVVYGIVEPYDQP